eukprot:1150508-Pelagomonas_calceolata.AAC.1
MGGRVWRFGGQVGCTPRTVRHVRPSLPVSNLSASHPEGLKHDSCKSGRTYAGSMQKTGNSRPQLSTSGNFSLLPEAPIFVLLPKFEYWWSEDLKSECLSQELLLPAAACSD